MKTKIPIILCFALSLCVEIYADGDQDVKRRQYPYMAFIYYSDETVVDGNSARFLRGAILIRPDWLVTSALGPSVLTDGPKGFPGKTLLARAGAISIDSKFTLNEDEDEQEREIIQIVRPYNHSATQWWHTDISLMKTLLPFNLSSAVFVATLGHKTVYLEKTCIILLYTRRNGNLTEDRSLMQVTVELLPPSVQNCGSNFLQETMTCASDSDENKNAVYDPNFCQGNSGGPLICENEVMGLQTYIDNNCNQPHLYQLLSAWDNFISCGTEDKCDEEQCAKLCDVANKDPPVSTKAAKITSTEETVSNATTEEITVITEIPITTTIEDATTETDDKPTLTITILVQTTGNQIVSEIAMEHATTEMHSDDTPSEQITSSSHQTTLEQSVAEDTTPDESIELVSHVTATEQVHLVSAPVEETVSTWPKERNPVAHDKDLLVRKTNVEARREPAATSAYNNLARQNPFFVCLIWYVGCILI